MTSMEQSRRLKLREIANQASEALALLNADKLEELAHSCHAVKWEFESLNHAGPGNLVREALDARRDIVVFARVLEAARMNLQVLYRLRDPRDERVGYGPGSTFVA
jgi:hypothetical protein